MQRICNPSARRATTRARWLLLVAALGGPTGCAARWELNYDYGQERAKKLNRPMLLYFKDWKSHEHRNFVVDVLENSTVANELAQTVNVELLYNWGPDAKRYGTTQTPGTFVYCRPDGTEIDRLHVGTSQVSPQRFAEWLRECRARYLAASTQPASAPSPAPV
jgi:hypothetical protein